MASCWALLAPHAPWLVLLSLSCPSTDRSRSAGACRPRGERSAPWPPGPARTLSGGTAQAPSMRKKDEAWGSSADELLVADQPDLRQAQPLRGGHQHRHALVLHQLVRPQVYFGLYSHGGRAAKVGFQICAIAQDFAVPDHGAVEIDFDGHHLWLNLGRRRRADRHVELHGVGLDGNGDDEHDEQHQHHVDERRGVDVHHHVLLAHGARSEVHRHQLFPLSTRAGGSVMKPILRMPARWQAYTTLPTNSYRPSLSPRMWISGWGSFTAI